MTPPSTADRSARFDWIQAAIPVGASIVLLRVLSLISIQFVDVNGTSPLVEPRTFLELSSLIVVFPLVGLILQDLLAIHLRREFLLHRPGAPAPDSRWARLKATGFLVATSAVIFPSILVGAGVTVWLPVYGWWIYSGVIVIVIAANALSLPYGSGPDYPYAFSPPGRLVSILGTYACGLFAIVALILEMMGHPAPSVDLWCLVGTDIGRIALFGAVNIAVSYLRHWSTLPEHWVGGRTNHGTILWLFVGMVLIVWSSYGLVGRIAGDLPDGPTLTLTWLLSVPCFLVAMPLSIVAPSPSRQRRAAAPAKISRVRAMRLRLLDVNDSVVLHVVRAHLLVSTIASANIHNFALSLPASAVATGALATGLDLRIVSLWIATTLAWLEVIS